MRVSFGISWSVKSPWPAIRDFPTRTRTFTLVPLASSACSAVCPHPLLHLASVSGLVRHWSAGLLHGASLHQHSGQGERKTCPEEEVYCTCQGCVAPCAQEVLLGQ